MVPIRISVFLLCLLFIATDSIAQHTIEKNIIDEAGEPIPYVNVGVLGTLNGTVANEDGWFSLNIENPNSYDTLIVSAIGYKRWKISTEEAVEFAGPVTLEKEVYELGEVVVSARKLVKKKYGQVKGTKKDSRATLNKKGFEEAVLVESKVYPFKVSKAVLRVEGSNQKQYSFRVRFYAVNPESGIPGEELTKKNYILTSERKRGNIEIDLEDEEIWFDEPVYLSFEWLINKEDEALTFTLIDSVRMVSKEFEDIKKRQLSRKERKKLEEEQGKRMNALVEKIPLTYYAIKRRTRVKSFGREIFLDKWKKNRESIVGYLEVFHESS